MGLRSLRIPTVTIKLTDTDSFEVRALSLPDVSYLTEKHGATLGVLYERFITNREADSLENTALVGKAVLQLAPELAVEAITVAAGEAGDEEALANARKLPFTRQLEALQAIFSLTFKSEEDWGNVLEIVISAAEKGMAALKQAQMPVESMAEILGHGSEISTAPLAS